MVAQPGVGIGYVGEVSHDRGSDGVLWTRMCQGVQVCGVYGSLYQPGSSPLRPTTGAVAAFHEAKARWIPVTQMVGMLCGCSFMDLGAGQPPKD